MLTNIMLDERDSELLPWVKHTTNLRFGNTNGVIESFTKVNVIEGKVILYYAVEAPLRCIMQKAIWYI